MVQKKSLVKMLSSTSKLTKLNKRSYQNSMTNSLKNSVCQMLKTLNNLKQLVVNNS